MPSARYVIAMVSLFGLFFGFTGLAHADAPEIPDGVAPLAEGEIKRLLDGKTYAFVAYDEPLTGTTSWDFDGGTVSGRYVWNKSKSGTFSSKWFLRDGLNCTQSSGKDAVCQVIYPYGDGFMEVTPDGVVHAVSRLAGE